MRLGGGRTRRGRSHLGFQQVLHGVHLRVVLRSVVPLVLKALLIVEQLLTEGGFERGTWWVCGDLGVHALAGVVDAGFDKSLNFINLHIGNWVNLVEVKNYIKLL